MLSKTSSFASWMVSTDDDDVMSAETELTLDAWCTAKKNQSKKGSGQLFCSSIDLQVNPYLPVEKKIQKNSIIHYNWVGTSYKPRPRYLLL